MMVEKIEAKDAAVFWNAEPGKLPTEFIVVGKAEWRTDRKQAGGGRQSDPYRHLMSSAGALIDGWLQPGYGSPERLFAEVFLDDLPADTRATIVKGLREFTKIEGQEWAERMLLALDRSGGERPDRDVDDEAA